MIPLLKFSKSNGKLSNRLIFSIPAGYTCPHAGKCHTFALRETGEIRDNPHGCSKSPEYRCFAAMAEARFPTVRKSRWHNFDQLRAARNIYVDQHPESPGCLKLAPPPLPPAGIRVHQIDLCVCVSVWLAGGRARENFIAVHFFITKKVRFFIRKSAIFWDPPNKFSARTFKLFNSSIETGIPRVFHHLRS